MPRFCRADRWRRHNCPHGSIDRKFGDDVLVDRPQVVHTGLGQSRLCVDHPHLRIDALLITDFGQPQVVPIEHLRSVGPDAVTVAGRAEQAIVPQTEITTQETTPQEAIPETALPPLQQPLDASEIHGHKVITDSGTLVGEVQDIVLDPGTLAITGYEVRPGGLFARAQEIAVTPEVRHGENLITVPASLLT